MTASSLFPVPEDLSMTFGDSSKYEQLLSLSDNESQNNLSRNQQTAAESSSSFENNDFSASVGPSLDETKKDSPSSRPSQLKFPPERLPLHSSVDEALDTPDGSEYAPALSPSLSSFGPSSTHDDIQAPITSRSVEHPPSAEREIISSDKMSPPLPADRPTLALIKMRAWDPLDPSGQVKIITAANILIPPLTEEDSTAAGGALPVASGHKSVGTLEPSFQRPTAASKPRPRFNRLSSVEEEPTRNPSMTDESDDSVNHTDHPVIDDEFPAEATISESGLPAITTGEPSIDIKNHQLQSSGPPVLPEKTPKNDAFSNVHLAVGSLIGVQLNLISSSASKNTKHKGDSNASIVSAASSATGGSYASQHKKQSYEWRVGSHVHVHNLNLLSISNISELLYRIECNHPTLRELILDGQIFQLEEAQVLLEALGTNNSVKRLSMRHAEVDDDIAETLALALVDNSTITQIDLEGNHCTNIAAKSFYTVLKRNNDTLRLLDLTDNLIDADVEEALDQFMGQRELKRTLYIKAEKAKRAAKGLPSLPVDERELDLMDEKKFYQENMHLYNHVTVVCHPSIIDGSYHSMEAMKSGGPRGSVSSLCGPTIAIGNSSRASDMTSLEDHTLDDETTADERTHESTEPESREDEELYTPLQLQTGRLIISRVNDGNDQYTSYDKKLIDQTHPYSHYSQDQLLQQRASYQSATSSLSSDLSSLPQKERNNIKPSATHFTSTAGFHGNKSDIEQGYNKNNLAAIPGNTSMGTIELSGQDYVDEKATEREIRRQIASQGARGAFHVDEPAPNRQGRRRGARRTESQRLRRLNDITAETAPEASAGDQPQGPPPDERVDNVMVDADVGRLGVSDMDIESSGRLFPRGSIRKALSFRGERRTDKIICIIMGALALILLILVIFLLT